VQTVLDQYGGQPHDERAGAAPPRGRAADQVHAHVAFAPRIQTQAAPQQRPLVRMRDQRVLLQMTPPGQLRGQACSVAGRPTRALLGSGTSALLPCHMAMLSIATLRQNGTGGGGPVGPGSTPSRQPPSTPPPAPRPPGPRPLCAPTAQQRTGRVHMFLNVPECVGARVIVKAARDLVLVKAPRGQQHRVRPAPPVRVSRYTRAQSARPCSSGSGADRRWQPVPT
jgi:hypothetical protein